MLFCCCLSVCLFVVVLFVVVVLLHLIVVILYRHNKPLKKKVFTILHLFKAIAILNYVCL